MGDVITVGSKTSTGGVVLTGNGSVKVNGQPVALIGDMGTCLCGSKSCKGQGPIVSQSPRSANVFGEDLARIGDLVDTGCGSCFIVSSSHGVSLSTSTATSLNMGSGVNIGNGVNINGGGLAINRSLNSPSSASAMSSTVDTVSNNPNSVASTLLNNNIVKKSISSATQLMNHNKKEFIAVIGGQYDNTPNKMMFIAQAVRYMRKNVISKDNYYSLVLVTTGYSNGQIELVKSSCEKYGFSLITVTSLSNIIQYINNRNNVLIEKLMFFAHGIPFSIEFGYKLGSNEKNVSDLSFNLNTYKNITPEAFSLTAKIESYACRTGMGNPSDLSVGDVLDNMSASVILIGSLGLPTAISLQALKTKYGIHIVEDGVQLNPMSENSLAQYMANYYKRPVKAFVTRSDYKGTWGTSLDRKKAEYLCNTILENEEWCDEFDENDSEREENIEKYKVVYNIDGALNDVSTSIFSTPVTLGSYIKEFLPQ